MFCKFILSLTFAAALATPAHADAPDLSGRWQSPFIGDPQGWQVQKIAEFDETQVIMSARIMLNNPVFGRGTTIMRFYQDYVLSGHDDLSGGEKFDMTLTKVSETPLTLFIVEDYNRNAYCGFTDWATGVEKDVTGANCDEQVFNEGDKDYGLLKIEDDTLYFGLYPDEDPAVGSTPDHRPTAFDVDWPHARAQ